jgi:outer membrane receptor protein involved in Fe transport
LTLRMMRVYWVTFLFVMAVTAAAQEANFGTVTGRVVEQATRLPVPFASVSLLSAVDSALVAGQVADSAGRFSFSGVPAGDYYLRPQSVGYKPRNSARLHLDAAHPLVDAGPLALETDNIRMKEVDVTAEKLLYSSSVDRKVYNVERDLVSKAGSASDLLHHVPSVQVDMDGTVSLRGSSNVQFMVDGRSSPLLNHQSATVLEQMPASSIERIEVITNPSAEYKPDAAAGIINIVLKKSASPGMNGTLSGNAGNSERYNSSVNLNYNPGTGNLYASYSIRRNNRDRHSGDQRTTIDTSTVLFDQTAESHGRPLTHFVTLGGEYRLDSANQLGFSGSYFHMHQNRGETSQNRYADGNHTVFTDYARPRTLNLTYQETELSAFWERTFAGDDHSLRVEASASRSPEHEDNRYAEVYRTPAIPALPGQSLLKNLEKSGELKAEYSRPLSEKSSLKAGYEAEYDLYDGDYRVDAWDGARTAFFTDTLRSNHFQHHEWIHALFVTYKRSLGRLGLLAGLRGEYVTGVSDLLSLDSTLTQSYTNLYPSLHLSYGISKPVELQASYSRRADRPDSDDLNPFPDYIDPRNISAGNPRLLPEYIHSMELGCQYQNQGVTLVPALFYRYTTNRITWVEHMLSDTVILTTHENLSSDQAGGLELNVSVNGSKRYSLHGNASVFRNQIDASNLQESRRTVSSWSGDVTLDVNLTPTTRLQINSNYRSATLTAQGRFDPRYVMNGGFRQELYGGKILFLATVSDLFHTMKRKGVLDTPTLHEVTRWNMDSRVVYAGFTYRFGSQPRRSADDRIRYEEAQ